MLHNVAVIGNGYWGRNLIRNFSELGALGVICDADQRAAAEAKAKYPGVLLQRDYSEVLRDDNVDAVVLATPAAMHYHMARRALDAGKDVFVEKPLSLTVTEGAALVDLADRDKRILMVGHILQYHPAVRRLKEMIASGLLGRIQYVYSNRLNIGKIRTEENILWSFAPHDISVIVGLLGESPTEVTCEGSSYLSEKIADVTVSQFLFASGVRAHIFVSWLHPFKEQRLVVVGSEQMAVFDDGADNKLVVYPHRVEWKNRLPMAVKAEGHLVQLDASEPLKEECKLFLQCLASRQAPVTDGHEGLRVLKVLNACQKSLESCQKVVLEVRDHRPPSKHFFAHETATIGDGSEIGAGTKIWHYSHVMQGAKVGAGCSFGQNCHVASGAVVGNNVKVQNNVSIYAGVVVEDDVFLGPSSVFTNVKNPRAEVDRHSHFQKTILRRGATIGANATIVCGSDLGRYCFIGAGSLVTGKVPEYALMIGNPARQVGWMSRHGQKLVNPDPEGVLVCPESGYRYTQVRTGVLRCLDLDEEAPLPKDKSRPSRQLEDYRLGMSDPAIV